MSTVLHFRRQLFGPPDAVEVPGICVRNFGDTGDVAAWIALRDRAMVDQMPRGRAWSEDDFRTEMLCKPWWCNERSWIAFDINDAKHIVGSVTLALREGATAIVPVVHWLLMDPRYRRRGVGRLLMSCLELAAWHDGWREIELETHAGWTAAVAFYQSIGYAPVRDRSPR
jgi:GNAT superfamily N-acetyltransferase